MSTIHVKQTTTATPEQFIAGLTDFGPGRAKLFGNSTDQYLKVHEKASNYADVTEGSAGIWERLHLYFHAAAQRYDRSGCRDCARGQELEGPTARRIPWDRRQGTVGEVVCKDPESHRSPELRDRRSGKGLDEVDATLSCA